MHFKTAPFLEKYNVIGKKESKAITQLKMSDRKAISVTQLFVVDDPQTKILIYILTKLCTF